ncbi:MAG: apolipoprotein N-acyltransferase, partial [Bacteroidetes bacterium]|nr:apolipoprotein N-acyltransferase [Bacteroidota bacterium]
KTDFIVAPETALSRGVWESVAEQDDAVKKLMNFQSRFENLKSVFGMSSYKLCPPGEKKDPATRQLRDGTPYKSYNSALYIDEKGEYDVYHKSKLVVGAEEVPFTGVFEFLQEHALDFGGVPGSQGKDKERKVFSADEDRVRIAPAICWEVVFGDFMVDFIRKGANVIFVITNDGWWGDTPGHQQIHAYCRIRAIENRRSIARSANTGISSFINQRGDVSQATEYWVPAVIRGQVNLNNEVTFYSTHGDYLGRIALIFSALILLYAFTRKVIARKLP